MEFVSLRKAVGILGLHQNTLRKYADLGHIETIRSEGGKRLFNVKKYLEQKQKASSKIDPNGCVSLDSNVDLGTPCQIEEGSKSQSVVLQNLCALVLEKLEGQSVCVRSVNVEKLSSQIVTASLAQEKQENSDQRKESV